MALLPCLDTKELEEFATALAVEMFPLMTPPTNRESTNTSKEPAKNQSR